MARLVIGAARTLLLMATAAALLSACRGSEGGAPSPDSGFVPDPSSPAGIDLSQHADLQLYMFGDPPKDLPKVQAAINEMAEADLNASVTFHFMSWTDSDMKYRQLLSSGQPVDLLFTADWMQYQTYAKKGAFLPLDDLLPRAAPELERFVSPELWDGVRIDGKIYTVPSTYREYVTNGFVWREDLRLKYNLPEPIDIPSFEDYLAGIKKNEPGIQPLAVGPEVQDTMAFAILDVSRNEIGPMSYGMFATYDDPANIVSYWGSPEQLEDLKLFKSWADKGYFSKNELSQHEYIQNMIIDGSAAAMFGDNPTRYNEVLSLMQAEHPDWQLGYYPYPLAKGYSTAVHPTHNGFAIPVSSAHPERALAFYEKLVLDKRYNQLSQYGFEGVNYSVEDGHYRMIGDRSTNGFPREALNGWAWRNPDYMLFTKSYEKVERIFEELDAIRKPDLYNGFAEDDSAYQAEKAALDQVQQQYLYPLLAGRVEDVEAGQRTFMKYAKEAGLDRVQALYKRQWLAYLRERGIS